jgi:hypothetical protein
MSSSRRSRLALLFCVTLAACGEGGSGIIGIGGPVNAARVRLVNATSGSIDLTSGGSVLSAGGAIAPGLTSSCITVDALNATLGVRQAGGATVLSGFAPALAMGSTYLLIAFPTTMGPGQFVTLSADFTPATGTNGLRLFHAAPSAGAVDAYVTAPNTPIVSPVAANVGYGQAAGFFGVSAGSSQVRFTAPTTFTVVFDAGTHTFDANVNETLVLASPTGAPTAIVVPGC